MKQFWADGGSGKKSGRIALIVGPSLGLIVAVWVGNKLGGGDGVAWEIGQLIGKMLGGMLVAYLLALVIRPIRDYTAVLGVVLGLAFFIVPALNKLSFQSSAEQITKAFEHSSNRDELLRDLRVLEGGNRIADALLASNERVEQRWQEIEAKYPEIEDPLLDAPPETDDPDLPDLQLRRDALAAAANSMRALRAEVPALAEELPRIVADELKRAGAPDRFATSFATRVGENATTLRMSLYAAAARQFEASKLVFDHLINSFGAWQIDGDGNLIFDTQAGADRFNVLISEENKAVEEVNSYVAQLEGAVSNSSW